MVKVTAENTNIYRDIFDHKCVISAWFNNFDFRVFTSNGIRETHCMAIELMQNTSDHQDVSSPSINVPRISKSEMSQLKLRSLSPIQIHMFEGKRKCAPLTCTIHCGPSYTHLKRLNEHILAAQAKDIEWFVRVIKKHRLMIQLPNGFMTAFAKMSGTVSRQATTSVFRPLVDSPPSHPDTVRTTVMQIQKFVQQGGNRFLHISADIQLYQVAMQIKWSSPDRWTHFIVCLGGMHTIMSFIGCIGTFMCNSGLEKLLSSAFKGITYMMTGKAWLKHFAGCEW